jgi:hypothetical protein
MIAKGAAPGSDHYHGMFACSPTEFNSADTIKESLTRPSAYNSAIAITDKGFKISSPLWKGNSHGLFEIPLSYFQSPISDSKGNESLSIVVKWAGGDIYARTNITKLSSVKFNFNTLPSQDKFYFARSVSRLNHLASSISSLNILGHCSIRLLMRNGITPAPEVDNPFSLDHMWKNRLGVRRFMTYGHESPVGLAFFKVPGHSSLFMIILGLDRFAKPWRCLAGPGSPLMPSQYSKRREFLDR